MHKSTAEGPLEHREIALADYPERQPIEALTEANLARLGAARRALIREGGFYGRKLADGHYLDDSDSVWQLFTVSGLDNGIATVVFWKEVDDGRFSFHFAAGESEPRFFCFEN